MSRLVALSALCLLGTVACSSGEGSGEPTSEDALERNRSGSAAAVDLSKYSLVQALMIADRTASEAMAEAILSTSKKADKSDRKGDRDTVLAGMRIDGEPAGIECGKDGATGQMMCSLVTAIVRASDVTGRESGEPGIMLPTHAKLTGKLATAVAEALPKKADGITGAGKVECKISRGKAECDVPLNGLGVASTLQTMIDQTKEDQGAAKAEEMKGDLEKAVRMLYPEG